jgi:hypothetical protein
MNLFVFDCLFMVVLPLLKYLRRTTNAPCSMAMKVRYDRIKARMMRTTMLKSAKYAAVKTISAASDLTAYTRALMAS